jgi:hypothetical protein
VELTNLDITLPEPQWELVDDFILINQDPNNEMEVQQLYESNYTSTTSTTLTFGVQVGLNITVEFESKTPFTKVSYTLAYTFLLRDRNIER